MAEIARVIADSVRVEERESMYLAPRLTTLEVKMHRFVLAEFNTHRMFSRNSASSRAIPLAKQLNRVAQDPAWPIEWPAEQPGMQGGSALEDDALWMAQQLWRDVFSYTHERVDHYLAYCERGDRERLHKSLVNRLLEPFMYHTVIVTATEWDNFFEQRCSPLAQPEIRIVAEAMRDAIAASTPVERRPRDASWLDQGGWQGWHLPYIDDEDFAAAAACGEDVRHVSAARCARVSYLTHDGQRDVQEDAALYGRLVGQKHWSPLEHVARPTDPMIESGANFRGWTQLRTITERRMTG